ncbi:MAG: hypothetical protein K2W78_09905 [Xanthobacteraceae bacterium]|nr:hypothetical protein [Xanthobacteraceae bacterium]
MSFSPVALVADFASAAAGCDVDPLAESGAVPGGAPSEGEAVHVVAGFAGVADAGRSSATPCAANTTCNPTNKISRPGAPDIYLNSAFASRVMALFLVLFKPDA